MTVDSHFSLIDLSKQFPFEIDNDLKKQICFAETLIISCGHYEGDIEVALSESHSSCDETTSTEIITEDIKHEQPVEVKDYVEEEVIDDESTDENTDFQFYFFPDCSKPLPPQNSKASILIEDGIPKLNPVSKEIERCSCDQDKSGICSCFTSLPCKCGAKTTKICTCDTLKEICICDNGQPKPVCTCKESKICMCHSDIQPRPICTCDEIPKPCICHPDKFPSPICKCEYKPKFVLREVTLRPNSNPNEEEEVENHAHEGEEVREQEQKNNATDENLAETAEPCVCQKISPNVCFCCKGKECICLEHSCICGVQKSCDCEPADIPDSMCNEEDSKSVCSCKVPPTCVCDDRSDECKCFEKKTCTCGNPDNCKCYTTCECTLPCICDTKPKEECVCLVLEKQLKKGILCTCPKKKEESRKLKKVRAGKQGYRWCHDVDPRHTFFDYGYGRHDKILHKEVSLEKVVILGLHDEKGRDETCPIHGMEAPTFKKKVRKPSLDCCSAVGGISISVETLGEDKDKFLVQVVSHSSKEGTKSGAKVISIIDCNLHTMEENRKEHVTKRDTTKERRSYMAICESGYYNKVTRICGEQTVVKRLYRSFEEAKNFILEGANIVLMRYFGLCRYKGTIKTDTVLIGGEICESIYVSLGVSQAIVNNKPLFVVKVERHIIEPNGNIHQTLTVLTLRGYTISHEWADNSYVLHINPLLNVFPEKDDIEDHTPLRQHWREDLQLFSDYLDMKSARTSEGGRYGTENGTLTGTIREYLQALLLLKPGDALHFTRHYFGSVLSSLDVPHDEYFDPCSKRVRYYFFEE